MANQVDVKMKQGDLEKVHPDVGQQGESIKALVLIRVLLGPILNEDRLMEATLGDRGTYKAPFFVTIVSCRTTWLETVWLL